MLPSGKRNLLLYTPFFSVQLKPKLTMKGFSVGTKVFIASVLSFMVPTYLGAASLPDKRSEKDGLDSLQGKQLNEVVVFAPRATETTPIAQTNLEAPAIKAWTAANNVPHVLQMTPSLVVTSENGTASGYTSLRIRGTEASRINVTFNGIPLNNPESQEVFWVNIPDMPAALSSIQVQRGVGTSTNGPGAFGASIHLASASPASEAYWESVTTAGSFGTFQQHLALGSGWLKNGLNMDIGYSHLTSDGYLRNGWVDHESLFITLVKRFRKAGWRLNYIYGNQHTGITWEGASEEELAKDPRYNPAGEIKPGLYYGNESDNYRQHHLQTFYTRYLSDHLLMNAGLNYTNGFGYYEQYKKDVDFSSIGLTHQQVDGIIYTGSDIIRRKNMANDFYTAHVNLEYSNPRLTC